MTDFSNPYNPGQIPDFQFQTPDLSHIVQAALDRRKQQQQQSQQAAGIMSKLAAAFKQQQDPTYGVDTNALIEQFPNAVPQEYARGGVVPQHFARGGVASWSDPYGNEPLAAQEYHVSPIGPDVSAIAGVIARQHQAQQEQAQQNLQNIYKAANQYMQQKQSGEVADAVNFYRQAQESGTPLDAETASQLEANMSPGAKLQFEQFVVGQQRTDDALDAKYANRASGGGSGGHGDKVLVTLDDGRQVYVTGNQAARMQAGKAPNPYQQRFDWVNTPGAVTYWNPDYSKQLSNDEAAGAAGTTMAVLPDKTAVPYNSYLKMADQIRNRYLSGKYYGTPMSSAGIGQGALNQSQIDQADQAPPYDQSIPPEAAPPQSLPTAAPQGAGTPPTGSVRVVAPNGQSGTIPANRLDAYLKAGYRQL